MRRSVLRRRHLGYVAFDPPGRLPARHGEIIVRLQIQPELGRGVEVPRQPQRRIGRNGALAVDDSRNTVAGHAQRLGQCIGRQTEFVQKLALQNLAGVNRCSLGHIAASVVVHDFDLVRIAAVPIEANPILPVDSDAVLPFTVAAQLFQPIRRRAAQIPQLFSGIEHQQFHGCPFEHIPRHEVRTLAGENRSGLLARPSLDCHSVDIMPPVTSYVNRTYGAPVNQARILGR